MSTAIQTDQATETEVPLRLHVSKPIPAQAANAPTPDLATSGMGLVAHVLIKLSDLIKLPQDSSSNSSSGPLVRASNLNAVVAENEK